MTRPLPPPFFFLSLLLTILSILSLASASAPTFCKCTCFTNSTIIPLGPQSNPPPSPPPPASPNTKAPPAALQQLTSKSPFLLSRSTSSSCTQCNRAFCLQYNLPICKDAEEKDIVTSCFQRDSRKDKIIVWGFILGTLGLLGWAGVKRVVEGYEQGRINRPGGGGRGSNNNGGGGGGGVFGRVVGLVGGGGTGQQGGGVTRRGGSGGGGGQQEGVYTPLG
ncbi:hypothetical protein QBC43DRAFT_315579 [Cladorrhinum sp. PSN259]|nr:hypothetical protein QBC43DRAFT_315579 [Cladorrhinum sp. PSN259]